MAATNSFAAKGYVDTTLADVADQLNVTIQALYYYFKNKDELVIAVARNGQRWASECIDQADKEGTNGLDKYKKVLTLFISRAEQEGAYVIERLPQAIAASEAGQALESTMQDQRDRLVGFIKEGIRDGSIRQCDPYATFHMVFAALNHAHYWAIRENYTGEQLIELFEDLADRLWSASLLKP